jgi:hypothetical protein
MHRSLDCALASLRSGRQIEEEHGSSAARSHCFARLALRSGRQIEEEHGPSTARSHRFARLALRSGRQIEEEHGSSAARSHCFARPALRSDEPNEIPISGVFISALPRRTRGGCSPCQEGSCNFPIETLPICPCQRRIKTDILLSGDCVLWAVSQPPTRQNIWSLKIKHSAFSTRHSVPERC